MNMVYISIDEINVNVLLSGVVADVLEHLRADVVLEEGRAILCRPNKMYSRRVPRA